MRCYRSKTQKTNGSYRGETHFSPHQRARECIEGSCLRLDRRQEEGKVCSSATNALSKNRLYEPLLTSLSGLKIQDSTEWRENSLCKQRLRKRQNKKKTQVEIKVFLTLKSKSVKTKPNQNIMYSHNPSRGREEINPYSKQKKGKWSSLRRDKG